jgi:scyllo-inositol 2-dehydrogenase (NADP+)
MRATFVVDEPAAARAVPLQRWLERVDGLAVTVAADPGWSGRLAPGDVLVALVDEQPLGAEKEQAIAAHVEAGGGIVLLARTLHAWRDATSLSDLVGKPGDPQRPTELIVEVAGHSAARAALARLDPQFPVTDQAWLGCALPPGAMPWLATTWHFREQPLGWATEARGRAVVLTLGSTAAACTDERVARLVLRAIRYAAAGTAAAPATAAAGFEPNPVRVGMLGWGAIGAEHAEAIGGIEGLELTAVCDRDPVRLAQAGEAVLGGCDDVRLLPDAADLVADDGVDLVVVSVPSHRHAEAAIAMLRAGKHVVVEKPFALTAGQADAVLAEAAGRCVTVYQNRRWDPDFRLVRDVVRAGAIGEVFHVETFVGGFAHPCRYWHSHEAISGGVIYDWGSHYLDWLLQLIDAPVTAVTGARHKRVWHDVTNADMARVGLRFDGGQEAGFIHSDVAAAAKPKWYVLGTEGALTVEWQPGAPFEQTTVRVHRPAGPAGSGVDVETFALPPRLDAPFHRNLADHLLCGEPLAVTPAQARLTTEVLEAASASAAKDGCPVHLSG